MVALKLQGSPQLTIIVNLAVENDLDRAAIICHRLATARRQIDY
jgi:hypothetical protein